MNYLFIFLAIFCLQFPFWTNGMEANESEANAPHQPNAVDLQLEKITGSGYSQWQKDIQRPLDGFVVLVTLEKGNEEMNNLAATIERGFHTKQPEAFYEEMAAKILEMIEKNSQMGFEFIVEKMDENVKYLMTNAQIEMREDWADFMEKAAENGNLAKTKANLLQYLYIAQLINLLNSEGNGWTKLFRGGNLVKEFESLRKLFRVYLARWAETQILAKLEWELLPWAIGRCTPRRGNRNHWQMELAKFSVRISLLYPIYQNANRDEEYPFHKKLENMRIHNTSRSNFAGASAAGLSIPFRQIEWIELMEGYLRTNWRRKRLRELDFRFYDEKFGAPKGNLQQIVGEMIRALGHWKFDEKTTGQIGPKMVDGLIKRAYEEVREKTFVENLKQIVVKNEKDRQRIEVISFYIRFYRHVLAKFTTFDWLKNVIDYILPYKYLATQELIAQNEGNKSVEKLFILLFPPENNAHFHPNLYKIEPKGMKERSQIYAILFGKFNSDEEFMFHKCEKIKFTIRNTVLPLLENSSKSTNNEGQSSSNRLLADFSLTNYLQSKKLILMELCAPLEMEIPPSDQDEEEIEEYMEKVKEKAVDCLEFILKDELLAKAIRNQINNGKTWREVFSAIRTEILSWGGENPLLKDLDLVSGEFEKKFEKMKGIKYIGELERKSVEILFIFTRLYDRLGIGFRPYGGNDFVEENLIGKYQNKREGTVLEAILLDNDPQAKFKFFIKKIESAKVLEPNWQLGLWRGGRNV